MGTWRTAELKLALAGAFVLAGFVLLLLHLWGWAGLTFGFALGLVAHSEVCDSDDASCTAGKRPFEKIWVSQLCRLSRHLIYFVTVIPVYFLGRWWLKVAFGVGGADFLVGLFVAAFLMTIGSNYIVVGTTNVVLGVGDSVAKIVVSVGESIAKMRGR